MDSYYTEEYPAAESWFDTLFSSDTTGGLLANRLRTTLGDRYLPFASVNAAANVCPIQALMPYFIFIN
ncbi:MAG: hypothetical protein LUC22_05115 [Prevotella sp.]|nr:hypothetical protein [Prevotella sp.]